MSKFAKFTLIKFVLPTDTSSEEFCTTYYFLHSSLEGKFSVVKSCNTILDVGCYQQLIETIEGKQAKENHNFCCLGKRKETKYHQLFTFIVSSVWTYKFEFGENNLDGNSSIDVTVL